MTGHAFSKVMLVGAAGIKPVDGEITDIFIINPGQIRDLGVPRPRVRVPEWDEMFGSDPTHGAGTDQAESDREMAIRLTWRPYMHNPRLPAKLARVSIPTHIVWGARTTTWCRWNAPTCTSRRLPGPRSRCSPTAATRRKSKSPTTSCRRRWPSFRPALVAPRQGRQSWPPLPSARSC